MKDKIRYLINVIVFCIITYLVTSGTVFNTMNNLTDFILNKFDIAGLLILTIILFVMLVGVIVLKRKQLSNEE